MRSSKPWGHERIIVANDRYAIKDIVINPGHRLSLQYHERKTETLWVLSGRATITVDDVQHTLLPGNEPITITPGIAHRIESKQGATLREVSTPELDDVVRIEDDYGRGA